MSREEVRIGLKSAPPRTEIPYSVSMPQIFCIAISGGYDG
jgi:hypothetical protein